MEGERQEVVGEGKKGTKGEGGGLEEEERSGKGRGGVQTAYTVNKNGLIA